MKEATKDKMIVALSLAVSLFVALGGAWLILNKTKQMVLTSEAEFVATSWAKIVAESEGADVAAFLDGQPLSDEAHHFFKDASKLSGSIYFKMFDRNGRLRLTSDVLSQQLNIMDEGQEHTASAKAVVASGKTTLHFEYGEGPDRPAVFSEVYTPLTIGGERVGVLEVYVDHSPRIDQITADIWKIIFAVAAACVIVIAGPLLAFTRKARALNDTLHELSYMASHDPLTGLHNRSAFNAIMQDYIRGRGDFAVYYIDLDKFKVINDTLGHAGGDQVLVEAARRLKQVCKDSCVIARLGGDEFVIIEPLGVEPLASAAATAKKIVAAMRAPMAVQGYEVRIGSSVGAACSSVMATERDRILNCADIALYQAKDGGRNRAVLYSHQPGQASRKPESPLADGRTKADSLGAGR